MSIPSRMDPPLFMYYKLTAYHQNHRRYVRSFDAGQLQGKAPSGKDLDSGDCHPLAKLDDVTIYPCGLIANSLFNDTYTPPRRLDTSQDPPTLTEETYAFTDRGIAWPGEAKRYASDSGYQANGTVRPPPYWAARYPVYNETLPIPDLSKDEHFQVWMRPSAMPDLRKLYFRNDRDPWMVGRYEMDLVMNYPVRSFRGTKSLIFSTVNWAGSSNIFLAVAWITLGGIALLLLLAMAIVQIKSPRKVGDLSQLSWNR